MYKYKERQVTFEVRVDGVLITTYTTSGTDYWDNVLFTDTTGTVIEITGLLAESEWLSIIKVRTCRREKNDPSCNLFCSMRRK